MCEYTCVSSVAQWKGGLVNGGGGAPGGSHSAAYVRHLLTPLMALSAQILPAWLRPSHTRAKRLCPPNPSEDRATAGAPAGL